MMNLRRRSNPFSFLVLLALFQPLTAQSSSTEPAKGDGKVEKELLDQDARLSQAEVQVDMATLEQAFAEDFTYTHSTGAVETRAQFLDALKSGRRRYNAIDREDVKARVYGPAAVITGRARIKMTTSGRENNLEIRFMNVYVKTTGRWQMVAWQSTRLPEPSPAPTNR